MHALILGGTTEASALAARLDRHARLRATLSLAGRTRNPVLPNIPHRIGGFGGVEGLAGWLKSEGITAVVDATHPFARNMPFNAAQACAHAGVPRLRLLRHPWRPQSNDRWLMVEDHHEATILLGIEKRCVFLTVGRLEMGQYAKASQHRYIVRSVDAVEERVLPDAVWLTGRGPFRVKDELALMEAHNVEALVTKNSGGAATQAKLFAANIRGIPVIMLKRPHQPDGARVDNPEAAMDWLHTVHGVSS